MYFISNFIFETPRCVPNGPRGSLGRTRKIRTPGEYSCHKSGQLRTSTSMLMLTSGLDRVTAINDQQWTRIAPYLDGKSTDRGVTARDNRLFVEGVLWIVREGVSWRKLPEQYGNWNSAYRRFKRWSREGIWYLVFKRLESDPGFAFRIDNCAIVWNREPFPQYVHLKILPLRRTKGCRNKPFLYAQVLAPNGKMSELTRAFLSMPSNTDGLPNDHREAILVLTSSYGS
ncbi:transposase [Mesorhizobium shangrilense]|uniref:Transposase n=1 Tax=Mesorhizobium shangrilense TaxID=460060 RepID=A0ABV2DH03_9HYPH